MLEQALALLNIRPGKTYVDATAGFGGHLLSIANLAGPESKIIGIDRDKKTIANLAKRVGENITLFNNNFSEIRQVAQASGLDTIDGGILADFGVSSMQIDDPERGFSFSADGPLDMRMDTSQRETAADLVNNLSEEKLAEIIFRYGEERFSRRIARTIVANRPLSSTAQLASLVSRAVGHSHGQIHPATRTFQALRIAVNDELGSIEKFLRESVDILAPGARIAVITFHSLEDRLVKQTFRELAAECLCPPRQPICTCQAKSQLLVITRKPIAADKKEVLANPRSRSAKLRAGEKRA